MVIFSKGYVMNHLAKKQRIKETLSPDAQRLTDDVMVLNSDPNGDIVTLVDGTRMSADDIVRRGRAE